MLLPAQPGIIRNGNIHHSVPANEISIHVQLKAPAPYRAGNTHQPTGNRVKILFLEIKANRLFFAAHSITISLRFHLVRHGIALGITVWTDRKPRVIIIPATNCTLTDRHFLTCFATCTQRRWHRVQVF